MSEEKGWDENSEKKMSALEYNIKNKGETSYYYAHKNKFEKSKQQSEAQTVTGPGIITGGDPILLQSEKKKVEVLKEPKKITEYMFYDDIKYAVVKFILPKEAEFITEDNLEYNFEPRSYRLKINVPTSEPYFLIITKLFAQIDPEKSTTKIINTKNGRSIKINFAKIKIEDEWTKVSV